MILLNRAIFGMQKGELSGPSKIKKKYPSSHAFICIHSHVYESTASSTGDTQKDELMDLQVGRFLLVLLG